MRRVLSTLLGLLMASSVHATPAMLDVDVFLLEAHRLTGQHELEQRRGLNVHVHRIDAIHRLQSALARELPADVEAAKQIVLSRLRSVDTPTTDALSESANALQFAQRLKVERVPAIVFDRHWVVYGVTNIEHAYRLFAGSTARRKP